MEDENDPVGTIPSRRRPIVMHSMLKCLVPGCQFEARRHKLMERHNELTHTCSTCGHEFLDKSDHECAPLQVGTGYQDEQNSLQLSSTKFELKEENYVHGGVIMKFERKVEENICMLFDLFELVHDELILLLKKLVRRHVNIRVSFRIKCTLHELTYDVIHEDSHLSAPYTLILHENSIEAAVRRSVYNLIELLHFMNLNGSNWIVDDIHNLYMWVTKYEPLPKGRGYIPLPPTLKSRQGILNLNKMVGDTEDCFKYSVLACLYNKTVSKNYEDELKRKGMKITSSGRNFALRKETNYKQFLSVCGIDFSSVTCKGGVSFKEIEEFELLNKNKISISVFGVKENGETSFLYRPSQQGYHHADLLYIQDGKGGGHYASIIDKSRFLGKKGQKRHIYCNSCNRPFIQQHALETHSASCNLTEGSTEREYQLQYEECKFRNLNQTLKQPNILYLSFHRKLVRIGKEKWKNVPVACSLFRFDQEDGIKILYKNGEDMLKVLLKEILYQCGHLVRLQKYRNVPYKLTDEERSKMSEICGICKEPPTENDPLVVHHCHWSGKVICLAHAYKCNPSISFPEQISIICLGGSDMFPQLLSEGFKNGLISSAVPLPGKSGEISAVTINRCAQFIDVYNYFPDFKLTDLISFALEIGGTFRNTIGTLKNFNMEDLKYYSSHELVLPPMIDSSDSIWIEKGDLVVENFKNPKSKGDDIHKQHEAYIYSQKHWKTIEPPGQAYLKFCLQFQSLVLGDSFTVLRDFFHLTFGLDLSQSLTLNSFALASLLYTSQEKIEYVNDQEIREMQQKLVRGPISTITKMHETSNNSSNELLFDPTKPESHLISMDIRSCFAYCMLNFKFPVSNYELMTENELKTFNYYNPEVNGDKGWIFEVNLELDKSLYNFYDSLPLFNEKFEFSISCPEDPLGSFTSERLVLANGDKEKRTYHYLSLFFLLKCGYKLKKVFRGFSFTQRAFMEKYTETCLALRSNSKSEKAKGIFKPMINVISGKFMSTPGKYPAYELCFTKSRALELLSSHRFIDIDVYDRNLTLFKLTKRSTRNDSLEMISGTIYELSKCLLYYHYYMNLIPVFGNQMTLLMSNTDSLFVKIQMTKEEIIDCLNRLKYGFDFSNLKNDGVLKKLYNEHNKDIAGLLRITHTSIEELYALRANCYSLKLGKFLPTEGVKNLSGLQKEAQKAIKHDDYKNAVTKHHSVNAQIKQVTTRGDKIDICFHNRIVLASFDDSRRWASTSESRAFEFQLNNDTEEGIIPELKLLKEQQESKAFVPYFLNKEN